jgi:hypothetical protein
MNVQAERVAFADVVKELLDRSKGQEDVGPWFMGRIAAINEDYFTPTHIPDPSLNAACNLCDDYIDALNHGFDDVGGIAIPEVRNMLREIVDVLERGDSIEDSLVLQFYHKPPDSQWKWTWNFPWLRHKSGR